MTPATGAGPVEMRGISIIINIQRALTALAHATSVIE